ncbi:potassium transporter 20-like [Rhodamnia argentea]|uniref:Potassium transporter n=1 Tax=Rhodamnia argentea TaxID=178133 RepID=A0A8B8QEN1_9MYRT|nr:potassium transporter 20-like [Rhodamnia argentea]
MERDGIAEEERPKVVEVDLIDRYDRRDQDLDYERTEGDKGSRKIKKIDSFYVETGQLKSNPNHSSNQNLAWVMILKLAIQSIGVVYGDLGTSPLYVMPGIFPDGIKHEDDILGALSLIFYSIILIGLIKYVFIVLSANDNGDGGTFALYSLMCRYAKASLTPNQQAEDKEISNYRLEVPNRRLRRASAMKSLLENSKAAKYLLLFVTMLGTAMVIGDGILTPCISVLSAVGGIREAAHSLGDDQIMWISVVILILLFQVQRFGTDKVGYSFAPVLSIWFLCIGLIGIYNFAKHDSGVIRAVNPLHIIRYFMRNKKEAWISLGGVILCLTGSEALFADLGHFNILSIRLSSCLLVFPSIILAYFGQAAYLRKNTQDVARAFYSSIPKPVYWPMFVIAVMAAIIASQSLISAAFAIVKQSVALGCFPRVKVVHTSSKHEGQIYIPEVNTLLMLACVGVTLGFKTTLQLGNAYGIAVAFVFTITSTFLVIVMIMIWKTNILLIILYVVTIGLAEYVFLTSVLYKFVDGGYVPLVFAAMMVIVMFVWNYGYRRKYEYELKNKVSREALITITSNISIQRLPGIALFYTELVQGISPIFTQYVANVPALHSVLVFVSIKSLPISKVPLEERFVFRKVEPGIYRCVGRYGYRDAKMEQEFFEKVLINRLKDFILNDALYDVPPAANGRGEASDHGIVVFSEEDVQREIGLVEEAIKIGGIVYLMGESEVIASSGSGLAKMVVINYLYNSLKRCVRQQEEVFNIPHKWLLKVGMTYEV